MNEAYQSAQARQEATRNTIDPVRLVTSSGDSTASNAANTARTQRVKRKGAGKVRLERVANASRERVDRVERSSPPGETTRARTNENVGDDARTHETRESETRTNESVEVERHGGGRRLRRARRVARTGRNIPTEL